MPGMNLEAAGALELVAKHPPMLLTRIISILTLASFWT